MQRVFPGRSPWRPAHRRHLPAGVVRFFCNGHPIGDIADPGFAHAFFGIWLDPKSSQRDYRQTLLGEKRVSAVGASGAAPRSASGMLRYPALFAYGLFGMPLAMAALPLYVHLPKFYGGHLGVPLTALGGACCCCGLRTA